MFGVSLRMKTRRPSSPQTLKSATSSVSASYPGLYSTLQERPSRTTTTMYVLTVKLAFGILRWLNSELCELGRIVREV